MIFKKAFAFGLICALLSITQTFVGAMECSISACDNVVSAKVSAEGVRGKGIVATVVKRGLESIEYSDVYAMEQFGEKEFTFSFTMPGSARGDSNEQFSLLLKNGDDIEEVFDFYYVKPNITKKIFISLKTKEAKEIDTFLGEYTDGVKNSAGLYSIGVDLDSYSQIDNKAQITASFYQILHTDEEYTDNELSEKMNKAIWVFAMNGTNADVDLLLKKINPTYENVKYLDLSDKEKSSNSAYIKANVPFSDENDFDKAYHEASVIFKFNNGRYSHIDELLKNSKDILELSGTNYESKYLKLGSEGKIKIAENIIYQLKKNQAETIDGLKGVIKNAISAYSDTSGGGSGGSGGGGSSSSKSDVSGGFTVGPQTQVNKSSAFSDIESVEWAKEAIIALYDKGIISGMGDGKYMPSSLVTREQLVKIIICSLNSEITYNDCSFSDVKKNEWYYPYIAKAVELGIVNGIDHDLFGIGQNVTRQDAAVMICRAMGLVQLQNGQITGTLSFSDNSDIASYAKESVECLLDSGIINGKDNNRFAPNDTCTRAEAAKMIYNALGK